MTHEAVREKLLDVAYGELAPREAREVEEAALELFVGHRLALLAPSPAASGTIPSASSFARSASRA